MVPHRMDHNFCVRGSSPHGEKEEEGREMMNNNNNHNHHKNQERGGSVAFFLACEEFGRMFEHATRNTEASSVRSKKNMQSTKETSLRIDATCVRLWLLLIQLFSSSTTIDPGDTALHGISISQPINRTCTLSQHAGKRGRGDEGVRGER